MVDTTSTIQTLSMDQYRLGAYAKEMMAPITKRIKYGQWRRQHNMNSDDDYALEYVAPRMTVEDVYRLFDGGTVIR